MPALIGLREVLIYFRNMLRADGFDIVDIPDPNATGRQYAFWFALVAFALQTSQRDNELVSGGLLDAFKKLTEVVRRSIGMQLPKLPDNSTIRVLGMASGVAATGVGGDCWCREADGSLVAMEVIRNHSVAPELEMSAGACGYTTEYETHGAMNDIRKR